jgi:hypothetical protein
VDQPPARSTPTKGDRTVADFDEFRRERRARRRQAAAAAAALATDASDGENLPASTLPPAAPATAAEDADGRPHGRERRRPRAPRANRPAVVAADAAAAAAAAASDAAGDADTAPPAPETEPPAPLLLLDPNLRQRRAAKVAARARRKSEDAAAVAAIADDHPALGALNRHLNVLMQQLTIAHRVIGRVAAERDALRQQLADLQGISVEEIKVTTIGVAPEQEPRPDTPEEPPPPSRFERLRYFSGDDLALVRKRRQGFVLVLLLILVVGALIAQQLHLSPPDDVSREALTKLPIIGNLMTVFLAGWILYRVVKISSKGVGWVFPSEDRKRRRR